jgi:xylan 1,4-beta-xylosidase
MYNKNCRNHKSKLQNILKIAFLVFAIFSFLSCNNKSTVQVNPGEAYFEYVKYSGSDSYYDQNPLGEGEFYNPILPGFYPDPSICQKGDDYYIVTSTFSFFPGIPVFHSKDLVNWVQIGNVLDRPSQFRNNDLPVSAGIYAPAIAYNPHNDTFYMTTTFVRGGGNFVVTAKDPAGPWSDPIWLPEVGGIDPSLYFDEDGRAYLTNNEDPVGGSLYQGHKATWIQEFDWKTNNMTGPRKMIRDGGHNLAEKPIWIEAPHIYKVNGYYYLTAAEGGTSIDHSQVIFRSKDIWGPYETNPNNPILTQRTLPADREFPVTNAGHSDLVETSTGDWYAVFLACRPYTVKNEYNIGRETFILPVKWEKGWPVILPQGEAIPLTLKNTKLVKDQPKNPNAMGNGNFSWTESFDKGKLALGWIFLRTPQEKWYTLQEGKPGITLKLRDVNIRELKQPTFLARHQQHHTMTIETKLVFTPSDSNQLAGLCLFQNEAYHLIIGLTKIDGKQCVVVQRATEDERIVRNMSGDNFDGTVEKLILAKKDLPENFKGEILLRASMNDGEFSFSANTTGEWETILSGIDATYLSTEKAGGFIGTVIGIYASSND